MNFPTIEKRNTKKGLRYYVVGIPSFEGAQLHGFKSEQSLMKCYNWWLNNVHLKHCKAKIAKKNWKDGGREKFYESNKKKI